MAKTKKEAEAIEVKAEEPKVEVSEADKMAEAKERFINRKLMAINKMSDRAKAQRLADRLLMNNK